MATEEKPKRREQKLQGASIPSAPVYTATELADRRPFYKFLDVVLGAIRFRHIPPECMVENLDGITPSLDQPGGIDSKKTWASFYYQAFALLRHDDALNWQKFNNMVLFNAALLTGFGFAFQYQVPILQYVVPLIGILFAWLFDLTLQEGMRCVRAHRAKVTALECKAMGPHKYFMFWGNPWNHRDALELAPLLLCVFWLILMVMTYTGYINTLRAPTGSAAPAPAAPQESASPRTAKPGGGGAAEAPAPPPPGLPETKPQPPNAGNRGEIHPTPPVVLPETNAQSPAK